MKNSLLVLALFVPSILAAQPEDLEPLPSPPHISGSSGVYDGAPMRARPPTPRPADVNLEEHGFNSQVLSVKVTPVVGYPYYLKDRNGDGSLDNDLEELEGVRVPEWVLFRW